MTFGENWGWGASAKDSQDIFHVFADAGGNFIDTAVNYTDGTSEEFLGNLVSGDRDRFVIATKYSLNTQKNDPNAGGNHRKNLMRSLETSLRRLKTDYIDLYYLHMWDFMTPIEEVMRGLDDVVRSGKVRYLGISDTPAWIVSRANTMAEMRGWTPFVSLQVPYSLKVRAPERELIPMSQELGLGVTAWGPLAAGLLSGKYTGKRQSSKGRLTRSDWEISEKDRSFAEKFGAFADNLGHAPAQIALNWVRQHSGVVIPVVGATESSQMVENLECLAFQLTRDQMKQLDDMSRIELGFPNDFLTSRSVRGFIFGDSFSQIDT
jgi:aryl-alcohol dehydrogenase-like predicted oxidoreductase